MWIVATWAENSVEKENEFLKERGWRMILNCRMIPILDPKTLLEIGK